MSVNLNNDPPRSQCVKALPSPGSLALLPRGRYWIGSDTISHASPRHSRLLGADVWIDQRLTTWRAFEAFVCGGGYGNEQFWKSIGGKPLPQEAIPQSVDARCDMLRREAVAAIGCDRPSHMPWSDMPVVGLSWFEALAVCRFFGARLPFEVEWEAAVVKVGLLSHAMAAGIVPFQEWTLDRYIGRYWRADESIRGREWNGDREVVIRGHAENEPAVGSNGRRPAEPSAGLVLRGFRRVWDRYPLESIDG